MKATMEESGTVTQRPSLPHPVRPRTSRLRRVFTRVDPLSIALPALAFALVFGLWQFASTQGVVNEVVVPPPTDVVETLVDLLQQHYFWTACRLTVEATLVGFAIGSAVGLILGILTFEIPSFKRATYPWIVLFQNMPRIALAPLFLTWFGFGIGSKIVLAATIAFIPVLINTVVGLESTSDDSRTLMRSLGASRLQIFRYLSLPSAAPSIMAGLKLASTLSLLAVVVGEFVGATDGMGVLLKTLNFQLDIAGAFAVAVFMAIVGLLFYGAVAAIESKIIYWRNE